MSTKDEVIEQIGRATLGAFGGALSTAPATTTEAPVEPTTEPTTEPAFDWTAAHEQLVKQDAAIGVLKKQLEAMAKKNGVDLAAGDPAAEQRRQAHADRVERIREHTAKLEAIAIARAQTKNRAEPNAKDRAWAARQIAKGGR